MREIDYLIVGQGLAGTLLSYELIQKGFRVLVVDNANSKSASQVSSGIINPITGRKFVTSWMINDLFPIAKETYAELENELGVKFFYDVNIVRSLSNISEENDWYAKMQLDKNQQYACESSDVGSYQEKLTESHGYGELHNCARIDTKLLIKEYRQWLIASDQYLQEEFNFNELEVGKDIIYKGSYGIRDIVFCEGWRGMNNPYFDYLPFRPAKGEVLILKIPNLQTDKLMKNKLFFVPLGDNLFWVGASYAWEDYEETPTSAKREALETQIREVLKCPFEVVDHKAAIRPATKMRKPFLGTHFQFDNVHIFNGLGTKGASLGPYWAKVMVDYLQFDTPLDREVNIDRFIPEE